MQVPVFAAHVQSFEEANDLRHLSVVFPNRHCR